MQTEQKIGFSPLFSIRFFATYGKIFHLSQKKRPPRRKSGGHKKSTKGGKDYFWAFT
jgi:hypothetical protein